MSFKVKPGVWLYPESCCMNSLAVRQQHENAGPETAAFEANGGPMGNYGVACENCYSHIKPWILMYDSCLKISKVPYAVLCSMRPLLALCVDIVIEGW